MALKGDVAATGPGPFPVRPHGASHTSSPVPTRVLNDGHSIPQLGFGVFQIPPADTAGRNGRPRGRLPAHRHRRDVRQRARSRRRRPRVRPRPVRGLRHEQAEQRLPRARRRAAGVRRDARRRSASTTSTCSSSTGRCRRSTTATSCRPGRRSRSSSRTAGRGRSASRTSRLRISSASPPRRTSCRR